MNQSELRQWEHRCIQEEAARCVAACPLHVDAKGFCALLAQRRVDKAWQVLAKTLPLPGVLARLCDGPCKSACVRGQAGGSIVMERLERFCAENAKPVAPPRPLPSRGKSVAVVGGSMTGLCAAWELVRRGFAVTLHCAEAGTALRTLPESSLPQGVLDRELDSLKGMGVILREGEHLTGALIDTLLEEADAVFLDSDDVDASILTFGEPDELTLGTNRAGLFASRAGEPSVIFQAAAGRRAANSIERFTQGVSMVTGRELEGPYPTRLFTSLAEVESQPPALPEMAALTEAQVRDEAKRCLQCECMECVKSCEYLKHFKHYPTVYVRRIYNNESIVMGTRQANTMINSCMLCGLCEHICPNDFSMAEVCLQARRTLVEQGNMPLSAHEFALRDMAFADSDKCVVARHAPDCQTSDYLYFPGCQLTASAPAAVEAAYADLRSKLGAVGLLLHCCGAPAHWAGRQDLAAETWAALRRAWAELGSPRVIAACPTCLGTLRQALPDAEIVSHWSLLRTLGSVTSQNAAGKVMAVNDPCAARYDTALREDIRALLQQMNVNTVEPQASGELAQCCGYGGLLSEANPDMARTVTEQLAGAQDEDYVTYCVMCRDRIAGTGKRAMHLYDLLFQSSGADPTDPAARPSPGYSDRRENRVRLREKLLAELWKADDATGRDAYEAVEVTFTADCAKAMEERRILKSDVQKVLLQARESNSYLVHGETGRRLASLRPAIVTYWVEYEPNGDGFLVHNAWSHRMRIKGAQP